MGRTKTTQLLQRSKGRILLLIASAALVYLVLPRLDNFSTSIVILKQAHLGWVLIGAALAFATYALAAVQYKLLAFHLLKWLPTFFVQIAGAFVNRLLPAGVAGMGMNAQYLRRQKHPTAQALAVVGVNNVLGFTAHAFILGIVILSDMLGFSEYKGSLHFGWISAGLFGMVLAAGLVAALFGKLRKRVRQLVIDVLAALGRYASRPGRLAGAFLTALLLTTTYATILYVCTLALGGGLSWIEAFLVFTVGMVVGTATPTPGGVGGAEAALTAGLIVYGFDPPVALAVALLFRLITYWMAMSAGFFALLGVQKRLL